MQKLLADSGRHTQQPHEIKMRWVDGVLMAWCDDGWIAKVRPWMEPRMTTVLFPGVDDHADVVVSYRYVSDREVPAHIRRLAQFNELLPALPEDVPPYTSVIVPDTLRPWMKVLLSL